MRSAKPVDWGNILVDFVFWGVKEVAGWPIEHLPTNVLVNLWQDLSRKRMFDLNIQNHSAAMLAGIDQAKAANSERVDCKPWLPYDLSQLDKPTVNPDVLDRLKALRAGNMLPTAMIRDLVKDKILEPEK